MSKKIEVEGGEILLRSDEGHYAVIPAKHATEVQGMVDENCDNCVNAYIQQLPKESNYNDNGDLK